MVALMMAMVAAIMDMDDYGKLMLMPIIPLVT